MGDTSHTHTVKMEVETVARTSYGHLIALLSSKTNDIAAAEDALAEAFASAMRTWPERGIPQNTKAWLMTAAANKLKDIYKSSAYQTREELAQADMVVDLASNYAKEGIPDEQLKLLFVCAHPAIDDSIHTPLMLQVVLGLEAKDIATAFLMPASTLAQRLVRAKRKIKQAGIPFVIPEATDINNRLDSVMQAIYGAYSIDWSIAGSSRKDDLGTEALYLASLLAKLVPHNAEVLGLQALIAFSFARHLARYSADGVLIPLDEQDVSLWDKQLINFAGQSLLKASELGSIGRFQLEASIQSAHCARITGGEVNWEIIAQLYDGLVALAPTAGALVGRAATIGRAYGAEAGLNALAVLDQDIASSFQPAHATRARLLFEAGDREGASIACRRAIDLATNIGARRYLEQWLESI